MKFYATSVSAFEHTKKISDHLLISPNSVIIESSELTDILPYVKPDSLIIFDIDYTLFRYTTRFGSPEWYYHLVAHAKSGGQPEEDAIKKYYPLWIKAQRFNEFTLTDKKIPEIIEKLMSEKIMILAFTSRQSIAFELTKWQLKNFGINLKKSSAARFRFLENFSHPILFEDGILFGHDLLEKGLVFSLWHEKFKNHNFNKINRVKRIIFVDDNKKNVASMAEAAKKLGIEFIGIRYSACDKFKSGFESNTAIQEAEILMENFSDTAIRSALNKIWSKT